MDGNAVGVTDAAGTILVEDLTEGSHEVEVDAEGFNSLQTNVSIEGDDQTEIRVNLDAPGEGGGTNLGWIPGAVVIAGGVISFAMGIRSGLKVQGWDNEISDVRALSESEIDALATCVAGQNGNLNGGAETVCGEYTRAQALVLSGSGDVCRSGQTGQEAWQSDTCSEHSRHTILQYVLYGIGAVGIGEIGRASCRERV